jgi:hypothetical protein
MSSRATTTTMAGTSSSSNASTGHIPKPFPLFSIVVQSSIANRTTRLDLNLGDPIDNTNNGIRATLVFRLVRERNPKRKAKKSKRSDGSKRKTLTLILPRRRPSLTPATEGGGAKRHHLGATRRPCAHPRVHARTGEEARGGAANSFGRHPLSLISRWGLETVGGEEKRKEKMAPPCFPIHRRRRPSPKPGETRGRRPHRHKAARRWRALPRVSTRAGEGPRDGAATSSSRRRWRSGRRRWRRRSGVERGGREEK